MKVKKIKRLVEIEVWDCGNAAHTHRNESGAQRCEKRGCRSTGAEFLVRNIKVTELVVEGATYAEAGRGFGISADRTRQVVSKIFRELRSQIHRMGSEEPRSKSYGIADIRKNKEYWLKELALLSDSKKHESGTKMGQSSPSNG